MVSASGKVCELLEKFESSASSSFPTGSVQVEESFGRFSSYLQSNPLYETVKSMIGDTVNFEDLERRVMITSLNLSTGKPKIFLKLRIILILIMIVRSD